MSITAFDAPFWAALRRATLPGLLFLSLGLTACTSGSAPAGLYRLGGAERSSCPHPVQVLSAPQPEASEELASLSATCPYTSPSTCDRRLLERACQLGADAIIVQESRAIGRKAKPQLTEEAVAIRFPPKTRAP